MGTSASSPAAGMSSSAPSMPSARPLQTAVGVVQSGESSEGMNTTRNPTPTAAVRVSHSEGSNINRPAPNGQMRSATTVASAGHSSLRQPSVSNAAVQSVDSGAIGTSELTRSRVVLPANVNRNRTVGSDGSSSVANADQVLGPAASSIISSSARAAHHLILGSPYQLTHRSPTLQMTQGSRVDDITFAPVTESSGLMANVAPVSAPCLNPASEVNSRLDTQVEIKVYPCNNAHGKKKFTQFMVKPEGVIIQGTNRPPSQDIGTEYSRHIGRKLPRYELSDTRASQLLITSHQKTYYVVPAPEAFSRHSGTCRLLGDRKHTPTNHSLKVGDFLRVGSVGVVVIETHNGIKQEVMSEDRIQKIMQDTTIGGFVDLDGETDIDESSDVETGGSFVLKHIPKAPRPCGDVPTCYMCFDDSDDDENPLISPCKCKGDTQFVHVECLRKWHTAEADNQICFLSTVDATCSVCKSSFKSDFKLKSGHLVKLFQSSLEPPYVSLLIATKHEMAQRLFNTRFQLSFSTLLKPDGRNATRPLLLGRSSGSDMVLDYRTVSARHASIKFKNGEFVFSDAGSSNGSYLYVRQPVELSANGPSVQFRLGRSMISMKVVNKWNKRLLRAVVRRSNGSSSTLSNFSFSGDSGIDCPSGIASTNIFGSGERGKQTTRESIVKSLPALGMLSQQSHQHLDLIYALAIPKRDVIGMQTRKSSSGATICNDVPQTQQGEGRVEVVGLVERVDAADLLEAVDSLSEAEDEEAESSAMLVPTGVGSGFIEERLDDDCPNSLIDVVDEVSGKIVSADENDIADSNVMSEESLCSECVVEPCLDHVDHLKVEEIVGDVEEKNHL